MQVYDEGLAIRHADCNYLRLASSYTCDSQRLEPRLSKFMSTNARGAQIFAIGRCLMKTRWFALLVAAGAVFAVCLSSWTFSVRANQTNLWSQVLIYDLQYQETNNISIALTNFGRFGQSPAGSAGAEWPKGTGMMYIYGAGIWVGAMLDGDTIVIDGYNTVGPGQEFVPGPHYDPNRPEDKLYFSSDSGDLANWPDTTTNGDPIVIGEEDTWCIFNGHDPDEQGAGENPLPITVTRHSFAWNDTVSWDMIFFLYTIRNDTTVTLTSMYVGPGADNDVGDADNDLVGLNRSLSLGYTFTPVQEAGWSAPPPYYVGYTMLQAPKASDTVYVGQDPANPDTIIYPGEHLVLTAFKKFTRNVDANNDIQRYLLLAGYDFNYIYSPFSDSLDTEPSDKRQLLSAGPFSLEPGEVDTFAIAIVFSNGNTGGLDYLEDLADFADDTYDSLFLGIEEKGPKFRVQGSGLELLQNQPNPFRRSSVISYCLATGDQVSLRIYDITGRLVETLVNERQEPGIHRVQWNRKTNPSGVYFYRLKAGEFVDTRKMVVVD